MNIYINIGLDYSNFHKIGMMYGDLFIDEISLKTNTRNILEYCKEYNIKNIFVKGTMYNRNQRRALYKTINQFTRDMSCKVYTFISLVSLSQIYSEDSAESIEKNILQLKQFQPPREGVDCDYIFIQKIIVPYVHSPYINKNLNHDVPSHKESIQEHLKMVVKACKKSKFLLKDDLIVIGEYHDKGKFFDKEWSDKRQKIHYPNHAGISCYMFLMDLLETASLQKYINRVDKNIGFRPHTYFLTDLGKSILEVIYRHMIRYSVEGLSEGFINKNKINEIELHLLKEISKIDAENRIREDIC